MDQPDRIHLRDHIISAEIGAFQTERGVTQRLRFDATVDLAAPVSGSDDQVDRILSYDVLTGAIQTALADRRFDLLETLAERIAALILAHPMAARIELTIEKLDRVPGALGVTIVRRPGDVQTLETGPRADRVIVALYLHGAPRVAAHSPRVIVPAAPGLPLPQGGDARRIALLALDQAAWALAGSLGVTVADSRTELDWAIREGRAVVWAPFRMTADDPSLVADPVALAAWLATGLGADRLELACNDAEAARIPADFPVPVQRLSA